MTAKWNYRLISFTEDNEEWLEIREVHYRDDSPVLYSETAMISGNDIEALNKGLEHMKTALSKPILKASDFENSSSENDKITVK